MYLCFDITFIFVVFFFNKFKKTDNETFLNGLIVGK